MDPLTAFIKTGGFELGADFFMPMRDFKQEFVNYRRENGHAAAPRTSDYYTTTFRAHGLAVMPNDGRYYNGARVSATSSRGFAPPARVRTRTWTTA